MNGKRILITGATGFIGSNLVTALIESDTNILAVTTRDIHASKEMFGKNVKYIQLESESFKSDIASFSPNIVIHLASYSTSRDDIESMRKLVDSNIVFLSVLLDALKETSVELFLNTGSFSEYYFNDGELSPVYYYAATKTASRAIVKYYSNLLGMKYCTIIPYTVYGGNNKNKKIIDLIFDSLDSAKSIPMTQGEQVSDFIHINDVVSFYLHIVNNMNRLKGTEDYHLGSGQGNTLRKVAGLVEKISSKKTNIQWGGIEYRPLDMMRAIAPIYKLEKELGWMPQISIEEGLSYVWNKKVK